MPSVLGILDLVITSVPTIIMGGTTSKTEDDKSVNKGLIDDHSTTNNKEGGFSLVEYHAGTVMGTIATLILIVVCMVALCACYRFCHKWSVQKHRLKGYENGYPGHHLPQYAFAHAQQHQPPVFPPGLGSASFQSVIKGHDLSGLPAGQYEITEAGNIRQHRPALDTTRGSQFDRSDRSEI